MLKRFKDKALREEQKYASRIVIVELILAILLAFWQLNPCYIIGSSSRSFYKMLFTFTPYSMGINMGSVNGLLIAAVLLTFIGMLVYIIGGALILFEKTEPAKGKLSYALATILQLVALILIPVAKGKAAAIEGISNTALNQGYVIYIICFIITGWITVEHFKEALVAIGSYIVGFFEELETEWYSIAGFVFAAIIAIIGFIPSANPIRFSEYQPSKGLIPTVIGGFSDYVIGLTQVKIGSATYNAFRFTAGGLSGTYKLLGSIGFKVALYSSAALLISLIVVVVGLALAFVKKNLGSLLAFIGSIASVICAILMAVAGKVVSTHNVNYYSMFKNEGIVEKDYFPTSVPSTMGLVVFIAVLIFITCTLKAVPALKAASASISNAATKINVKAANVFTAIAGIVLVVFAFIPSLNILNISDKLASESLISSLGKKSTYLNIFQDAIDNQYFQASMISLLLASGGIILIGAVVAVIGSIMQLSLKNKAADIFAGCGVLATVIGFILNLIAYTKITTYDTIMYGTVGTSISSFKNYYQAHFGNGIVIFAVVIAILTIAYGFSIKGTVSLGVARIAAAIAIIGAFVPGLNPGRISDGINKNKGLWSSATGFSSFIENFNTISFTKALVDKRALIVDYTLCLIALIAIVGLVVGFCLSFGEIKFKRVSCVVMSVSSLVGFVAMAFMPMVCKFNTNTIDISKNMPLQPIGIFVYMLLFGICFLTSVSGGLRLPLAVAGDKFEVKQGYKLFLMSLPFIALVIVFSYLPLWGWRYSFYDYTPGTDLSFRNWVGWDWFKFLVQKKAQRDELVRVLRNTLVMSGLGLCTQVLPVIFAIFISEIRKPWFKKLVQTITTIPNFISWVLVYAIARALFESDGFINNFAISAGLYSEPKLFLQFSGFATCIWMLLFGIWKGLGWSAIIYIAAISGIDQQLYEAAAIDGAGRFKRMWHITVPGLMPTFMVMFLMAIAGCLSNGMDQYLVFKTSANKDWIEVLDYYVYRLGLGDGSIALATIVGMCKSIVSVVLLFVANGVSKLVRGESIV
jgi:putative aldouronate transport system permease protein